jgi:serine/threonine-protein kinase HipA
MKHFDYNAVTSYSYEQLFQTMRELRLPYPAAEQMFRRMVFNVLAATVTTIQRTSPSAY